MARRGVFVVALAMLAGSSPAAAQAPARVVIVTVDATTIADWSSPVLPAFRALLDQGAVALVAAGTGCRCDDDVAARGAAYDELARGGGLATGLLRRSVPATLLGDASGSDAADRSAGRAVADPAGSIEVDPGRRVPLADAPVGAGRDDPGAPAGRRTDFAALQPRLTAALAWARLVVVDLGDTARAGRVYPGATRLPWTGLALRDTDRFLAGVHASLSPTDLLIVAALVPPSARRAEGVHLGAVAISGMGAGLLASETTRRAGLVTVADIGATIASRLGLPAAGDAPGRAAVVHAARGPGAAARALEADLVLARRARVDVLRIWLWPAAALIAVALLLVVAGRGRRPGVERLPRRGRDLALTGLVAVAAAPAAWLLVPQAASSADAVAWLGIAAAAAFAFAARAALGRDRALAAALTITGAVAVADTLAGGPLARASALGPEVAAGVRLAGTSDAIVAVIVVAPALAAALMLDRSRRPRAVAVAAAATVVLGAFAAAAPTLGARTAAPAFGVVAVAAILAAAAGRISPTRAAILSTGIAATLATGVAAAASLLRDPPAAAAGSWVRATFTTAWPAPALVGVCAATVLLGRRRALAARAFWGRPALRIVLAVTAATAGGLLVAGANGIEGAATAITLAAPALLLPFLAPD